MSQAFFDCVNNFETTVYNLGEYYKAQFPYSVVDRERKLVIIFDNQGSYQFTLSMEVGHLGIPPNIHN